MKKAILSLCFILTFSFIQSQEIGSERLTDWSMAGLLNNNLVISSNTLIIDDFKADKTGNKPSDEALQQALNELTESGGIVQFGEGVYLFNKSINMPSNVVLEGMGAEKTTLKFNLNKKGNCVQFVGRIGKSLKVKNKPRPGDQEFEIEGSIPAESYVFIRQQGYKRVHNSWALNHFGQILYVSKSSGNTITTKEELRFTIDDYEQADVRTLSPIENSGLANLKIERLDMSNDKVANVLFKYAVNCVLYGVESNMTNYSHVVASHSGYLHIYGSYFHHGFSYGSGGKAYGVVLHFSTSNCLVENNIFNHLRHSMLLQAGANGNVLSYNYSVDPYWRQSFFPSGTAGDIVMHGNYAYLNLFEGNIVQNLVVDGSHGANGPFNTFFRNRIEYTGITCIGNTQTNQQNFIGNEITGSGLLGGLYLIFGSDHFTQYNLIGKEVNGINSEPEKSSLYLKSKPFYFSNLTWPIAGNKETYNTTSLPAEKRYKEGKFTDSIEIIRINNAKPQKRGMFKRIFGR